MKDKNLNHRGKPFFSLCPLRSLWLILLFAACVPAQTPPVLDATPGAAVTVTEDTYRNEIFSVRYPAGWRVITSEAGQTLSVIFAAPDNCALIVVSATMINQPPNSPACDQPNLQTATRNLSLGSAKIFIAGSAPTDDSEAFTTQLDQVATSLQAAP